MSDEDPIDNLTNLMERAARKAFGVGKEQLGRATRGSRRRLEQRQAVKDLDHFWMRLGKTAYQLQLGGELDHPAIAKAIKRIDELQAKIDSFHDSGGDGSSDDVA